MIEINKIYPENCLHTMIKIPDEYIDLIVTSPPYDKLRDYKGFKFPFKHIARQLFRITKYGGIVVWVVGDSTINGSESGTSFRQALFFMECGFNLHDTMIYEKIGLTMNHNRYEQEFEYMFIFSKGKPKVFNPIKIPCLWYGRDSDRTGQKVGFTDEKNRKLRSEVDRGNIKKSKIKGNIWRYFTGGGHSSSDDIAFNHPAIFPESLAADHIKSWSNEGDLIYDPFSGSGTTCKMAHLLNRRWIGSEISTEYMEISQKRLKPFLQQKNIFH